MKSPSKRLQSRALFVSLCGLAALAFAPRLAGQSRTAWSGILVSSACNADEAFNESPECLKEVPGARIALYDDTNRVMYALLPQEKIKARLGDSVTVEGRLVEDTIQLEALEPVSIGLEVGTKAPDFSLRDQSGRTQTLAELGGSRGTVLLFFRSADW